MKTNKITQLALCLLWIAALVPSARAVQGTGSTGGGNSTRDGDLFDFREVQFNDQDRLQLSSEAPYFQALKLKMKSLNEAGLRSLSARMLKILSTKPIYFTDMEINQEQCLNSQGIVSSNGISAIACQDRNKIVVRRDWWKLNDERIASSNAEEVQRGIKNQSGLLSHEALVGIMLAELQRRSKINITETEGALREVNRRIFSDKIDGPDLRNFLSDNNLGEYVLESEALVARKVILQRIPLSRCLSQDVYEIKIVHPTSSWALYSKILVNDLKSDQAYGLAISRAMEQALSGKNLKELCSQYKNFVESAIFEAYYQ